MNWIIQAKIFNICSDLSAEVKMLFTDKILHITLNNI